MSEMPMFTLIKLETMAARAEMCEEATVPGEQLRELIRLAIIGFQAEQPELSQ